MLSSASIVARFLPTTQVIKMKKLVFVNEFIPGKLYKFSPEVASRHHYSYFNEKGQLQGQMVSGDIVLCAETGAWIAHTRRYTTEIKHNNARIDETVQKVLFKDKIVYVYYIDSKEKQSQKDARYGWLEL